MPDCIFAFDEAVYPIMTIAPACLRRAIQLLELDNEVRCARRAEDNANIGAGNPGGCAIGRTPQFPSFRLEVAVHPIIKTALWVGERLA
ncbi:hypothetical protein GLUCORHAEAF1_09785 [Komagataeibacter rhaeticus AF1]|nr:hypothetical protein GLUCORHAEAF1_09785 [Komagataeibacter rhaeticus AF1]